MSTQAELAASIVDRYGPRRRVVLRVTSDDCFRLVDREIIRELLPRGSYVHRERVQVLLDIPAQLAIPEHRGIVDRLLGRHPGPLRELGAVVRRPVVLELELEVKP